MVGLGVAAGAGAGTGPVDRDVRFGVDFEWPDEALNAVLGPAPASGWALPTN